MTTEHHDIYPFRNDDRVGEEGFALETVINKNVILCETQANISIDTTPFGISTERWPGLEAREGMVIKASAAKHGIKFGESYAVPMSVSYSQSWWLEGLTSKLFISTYINSS